MDDVSGKLAKRPGFDQMIAFMRKNRKLGIVVIVDDPSRLAREVRTHFDLKDLIVLAGGTIESPNHDFDDDPDSVFLETLTATLAQHQRLKNGQQATSRMRARMQSGFYVHNPTLGYVYEKSPAGGSVLVRREPIASIIAEGLEAFASGRLGTQAEFKRFLEAHPAFPKTRHGHVTNQQAKRILTHPLYCGLIQSKKWDVSPRKGHHPALISVETFEKNQERLFGKPMAPARADVHIDFPMRGVVTCGCCHHPMTSNYSTGRSGKRFPYYVCRHRGCEKFGKSVRREIVEDAFESLLVKLKPSDALFDLFSKLFRKRWDEASGKAKEMKATLRIQAAAADKKIAGLLDRIMASESATVIKRYESEIEILERDKLVIAEKTAKCGTALPDYDATFRTAFDFIGNPWNLWKNGTFEDKRIVLKLTLDTPVVYDWNEGVRTPELSFPFKVLKAVGDQNGELAEREGFEPSIRF
ncbi:recombinase [Sphingobium amiense]|uniref:Recombinase n=2 Tax=Sphingobium amiense TaxID=135719 RepID=A0A494W3T4_9SPHN|nr:recombinase [Sphingobium amiense]